MELGNQGRMGGCGVGSAVEWDLTTVVASVGAPELVRTVWKRVHAGNQRAQPTRNIDSNTHGLRWDNKSTLILNVGILEANPPKFCDPTNREILRFVILCKISFIKISVELPPKSIKMWKLPKVNHDSDSFQFTCTHTA